MTLQICSYQGCYIQRFPCSSITFFQLPNDEPRRTKWLLNSGNEKLLSLKNNQKRYFCENHFQLVDIKPHFYRKLLYKNAVPVPYMGDNNGTPTTTSTTCATEFEEVEEEINDVGATYNPEYSQINEISDGEYEDNVVNDLNLLPKDCYIMDDNDNVEYIDENNIQNGCLYLSEQINDEAQVVNSETRDEIATMIAAEAIPAPVDEFNSTNIITDDESIGTSEASNEATITVPTTTFAIDDNLPTSSSSTVTMIVSSTTTDAIIEPTSQVRNDDSATTTLFLHNDAEIQENLIISDKSYESDKHFALSLVYYFQRLNSKKKAQAKIDILTYLVALEQDSDG